MGLSAAPVLDAEGLLEVVVVMAAPAAAGDGLLEAGCLGCKEARASMSLQLDCMTGSRPVDSRLVQISTALHEFTRVLALLTHTRE